MKIVTKAVFNKKAFYRFYLQIGYLAKPKDYNITLFHNIFSIYYSGVLFSIGIFTKHYVFIRKPYRNKNRVCVMKNDDFYLL